MVELNSSCCWNRAEKHQLFLCVIVILVLDSFRKQGIVFWFFALLKNLAISLTELPDGRSMAAWALAYKQCLDLTSFLC